MQKLEKVHRKWEGVSHLEKKKNNKTHCVEGPKFSFSRCEYEF